VVVKEAALMTPLHSNNKTKEVGKASLRTNSGAHHVKLPQGHRFFGDGDREAVARSLDHRLRMAQRHKEGTVFATLTFKNELTPYKAQKMTRRWLSRMSQALEDNGGSQLKSVCASEWQQRGVIHYHLLLAGNGLEHLSRKRWEARWEALGGGFARLYEADMKAAPYLAKYINTRLGGEVDFGGAWLGIVTPNSISRDAFAEASVSRQ
jgi:hypothetical protein